MEWAMPPSTASPWSSRARPGPPGCPLTRSCTGRSRRAPASAAGLASRAPGWASPPRSPRTRPGRPRRSPATAAPPPCRQPPSRRCGTAASAWPPAASSWSKSLGQPGPATWRSSPSTRQLPPRRSSNDTPGGGPSSRRMRPESRSWAPAMPATGSPPQSSGPSRSDSWCSPCSSAGTPATPTIPPTSPGAACYARGTPPRPSPAPPTCSPGSAASSSPPDFRPYGQARPHPRKSPTTPGPATPSPHNSETRVILPYRNYFQSSPMHGQFVLVALENDAEAILGRITTIASQGRLISPAGEDYALRQQRDDRSIPEDLREQFLKYRVNIRILGVLRSRDSNSRDSAKRPVFVPSHRRLPHVGAKVAFPSDELLRHIAGATAGGPHAVELGFLALGEFVYAGQDSRVGDDERLQVRDPVILPRFDIGHMVSRRSFVFARAGFGKSNLVKLLFANLYGGAEGPVADKRSGRKVPVGTVIFDPDGEYYWPDDKARPGLCDVPALQDRLVVFTDKDSPSEFYQSFSVDKVRLDIRELEPAKGISLVVPAERQDHQNIAKLKQLRAPEWGRLVDQVWAGKLGTDLRHFYQALQLDSRQQENEALAARGNMVRVVTALHDPSSQLLRALILALSEGKTSKEIAVMLDLGLQTIRSYRKTMMKKLSVNNVAGLTQLALAAGITHWNKPDANSLG